MPTFVPFEFPATEDGQYIAMVPDHRILFHRREQLGLTQQQVADMANMNLRQYQRIEEGQSKLTDTKIGYGLALCAALLLDPYALICPNVKQPDPDSLKPIPAVDLKAVDDTRPKRAGRKPIRRDIMHIYVNHPFYSMLIPCDVLEALGKPECIQIRTNKKEHRILLLPIWDDIEKTIQAKEGFDVPDYVYDGRVLVFPGKDFICRMSEGLDWEDEAQIVECRLVKDANGTIGILIDLKTAEPFEHISGKFVCPGCLDESDEEYVDEDDEDEDEDDSEE